MKRIISILLILSVAIIAGCYYDSEEKLYPVVSTSCDLTNVTFSATIKPILKTYCYSCHSNSNATNNGRGVKLENYADVKDNISKILVSVKQNNASFPMPVGGKLGDCEIKQIQKWSDNKTPNN